MKIIKGQTKTPFYIGMKLTCSDCGCVGEVGEEDLVDVFYPSGATGTMPTLAQVRSKCPQCRSGVMFGAMENPDRK